MQVAVKRDVYISITIIREFSSRSVKEITQKELLENFSEQEVNYQICF
jgi:hypothetical protein